MIAVPAAQAQARRLYRTDPHTAGIHRAIGSADTNPVPLVLDRQLSVKADVA